MHHNELISIIVPVYNTEKYIRQCIDSILVQNHAHWELILVDDGSVDQSGYICDTYADKYEKITVLHQENSGQTSARKAGLKQIKGKFVAFIDSDDWVEPDFLEKLSEGIWSEGNKCTIVSSDLIYNRKNEVIASDGSMPEGIYLREQIQCKVLPDFIYDLKEDKIVMRHTLPGMLLEAEAVKSRIDHIDERIRYDEDGVLVCSILLNADKMNIIRYKGYHYRENLESVNHASGISMIGSLSLLNEIYHELLDEYVDAEIIDEQIARYIQKFSIKCLAHELRCRYTKKFVLPYDFLQSDSKVIVYGAGIRGREFVEEVKKKNLFQIGHWVDKAYGKADKSLGVESPDILRNVSYDYILIAVESRKIQREVEKYLLDQGIDFQKIWPLESKDYFEPDR